MLFSLSKEQVTVLSVLLLVAWEKNPFLCTFSPYLYEREETINLLSCLMMVLSVIITFLLWQFLPIICCVVISLKWAAWPLTLS